MTWDVEFTCKVCGSEFSHEWTFGDNVTCPHCKTEWKTDYDINEEEDVTGPWLSGQAKPR